MKERENEKRANALRAEIQKIEKSFEMEQQQIDHEKSKKG